MKREERPSRRPLALATDDEDRRRIIRVVVVVAIVLVALIAFVLTREPVGQSSGTSDADRQCEQAVADAAAVGPMEDTVADLDPAIRRCPSVLVMQRYFAEYASELGVSATAREWATNRCANEPALQGTAVCREVAQ